MHYRKWDERDIEGLYESEGILIVYTEIDNIGNVVGEIGLNDSGKVVHKFPSALYPRGTYGLFDNQRVDVSSLSPTESSRQEKEFKKLWKESE